MFCGLSYLSIHVDDFLKRGEQTKAHWMDCAKYNYKKAELPSDRDVAHWQNE